MDGDCRGAWILTSPSGIDSIGPGAPARSAVLDGWQPEQGDAS
jgi:hypothetical protein